MGVTSKTVWNWEDGTEPRPEHMRALAKLFDRPVEEIQGMAESPNPVKLAEYINHSLQEFRDAFVEVKERMAEQDKERAAAFMQVQRIEERVRKIEAQVDRIAVMLASPSDEASKALAEALTDRPGPRGVPAPGSASPSKPGRASA